MFRILSQVIYDIFQNVKIILQNQIKLYKL